MLVAEGVEDQQTIDELTALDCDVVQGYHVSRPLPPDQLHAWLRARAAVLTA
ncbi:EAL domain-containing protein [Modestobacter sp. URMC 112]